MNNNQDKIKELYHDQYYQKTMLSLNIIEIYKKDKEKHSYVNEDKFIADWVIVMNLMQSSSYPSLGTLYVKKFTL